MSKKCDRCGGFHYGGKRARRAFNGFLRRLYRKRSREMAKYIETIITNDIIGVCDGR